MNASTLKEKAIELGFDLVGIAPAVRFSEGDSYRQWIKQGYAGEMGYLARHIEKREDCRRLFPPAQSVIVCGMSYHASEKEETVLECQRLLWHPAKPDADAALPRVSKQALTLQFTGNIRESGYIAKYARGDDYHDVLKGRLYALLAFIQQEISRHVDAKVCVDTVPILEKVVGKYAGLGWIGKNTCLINHRYGSWFFLGEILLNLEFDHDSPEPDRCGNCTRCLEACPTRALIAPYILDARRCLSYLTIEFKGSIPEEFRPNMGNRIFGCDRCQNVCPWNQKAEAPGHPEFLPQEQLLHPDLSYFLSLSSEEFNRICRQNPLQRPKLEAVQRNTVVAVGNSGNPEFIPELEHLYKKSGQLVQSHIQWAINQLSGSM